MHSHDKELANNLSEYCKYFNISSFESPNITKYPTTHLSNYVKKVDKLLIIKNIKEQYEKKINHLKSNS